MSPFFSIIIPVYNVAPYLRECLDSVLAQTFTDWEAICVDDGSTDGSGAILDEYAAKDKRFSVIHQKNAGVSAARNVGLDVARGDWIGFIDADDTVSREWVSVWDKCIRLNSNVDIVKLGSKNCGDSNKQIVAIEWSAKIYDGADSVSKYVLGCVAGYTPWKYVIRKSALGNLRFIEGVRINEDVLYTSRCLFESTALCVCSYDGYFYRSRLGSALRIGVYDEDMAAFLEGVETSLLAYKGATIDSRRSYQCWAAKRILHDILGCFVAKGVRPIRSIAKARDLLQKQIISLGMLSVYQRIKWFLIFSGGSVGFVMLCMHHRIKVLLRSVVGR